MEITKFDKSALDLVRGKISDALAPIGEEFGITLDIGSIRYSQDEFTTKLTVKVGGDPEEHARKDWDKSCWRVGLTSDDFGKEFVLNGDTFTVCGIKPRSPKRPILARSSANGKVYKISVEAIKR